MTRYQLEIICNMLINHLRM